MSILFSQRSWGGLKAENYIPGRGFKANGVAAVTAETALRSSAVWACLRLRADLISTMPLDAFRRLPNGTMVEVTKPPVLITPGGEKVHVTEWLYSSQFDLDRHGNNFGLITARDGAGNPARIELVPVSDVTVRGHGSEITEFKVSQKTYDPQLVWHEKQFTVPGLALGLSPVAYAAWSVGGYLSAQQFALDWFAAEGHPAGTLRNTLEKQISPEVAEGAKARFKAATANRDVFVTGSAWEYTPATADASSVAFLEQMKYGVTDVCRFFGVPADMIDAEGSSTSITYANVTQRNLQFLVMNLGPAIIRREVALSTLLPRPRFAKFATDAILRMDPSTVVDSLKTEIEARILAPSEARELRNRAPFTDEQLSEFDRLFPPKPGSGMAPAGSQPLPFENPGGTP